MNEHEIHLHKIQRNYRIKPSEELLEFWAKVETDKLHEDWHTFRFFKMKLFTLEQVAEFEYNDIRFYFNKKATVHLVRYYIPIASAFSVGSYTFVAAFDDAKHFIGVFQCDLQTDPIFLTKELNTIFSEGKNALSPEEFFRKEVSAPLIKAFDFDEYFMNFYTEEEAEEEYNEEKFETRRKGLIYEAIADVLEYVNLIFSVVHYQEKLEIDRIENGFNVRFIDKENRTRTVDYNLSIQIENYDSIDTLIPFLNLINYRLLNSNSSMIAEYGFYRIGLGIVLLQIEQLTEFMRQGIIPPFSNVHMPPIVYSSHPSGIKNTMDYEIKLFETQEEYDQYFQAYEKAKDETRARRIEEADFLSIVNYFLEDRRIAKDGFDTLKIPFEGELLKELQDSLDAPLAEKEQFNVVMVTDIKARGHCHIERFSEDGEAYFYFYDWEGLLKNKKYIDPLINKSLQLILNTYPLKVIYSEPWKEDQYRNEVLERAGFEFIEEHSRVRDKISSNTTYKLWKLDCTKFTPIKE